jgi:hypothetical protein
MNTENSKFRSLFIVTMAFLGWFAVLLQFYLIILNRTVSLTETIVRYFSFFTILTNILVALYFTFLLTKSKSKWGSFVGKAETVSAITMYIAVVGIVYNIVLRSLWNPEGWQKLDDELLHLVIPVLSVLFWIFFVNKKSLEWKSVLTWLIYPFVYFILILIRGAFSGYYPYPFIDVVTLGYSKVFINCTFLFFGFICLSLLFVATAKFLDKK